MLAEAMAITPATLAASLPSGMNSTWRAATWPSVETSDTVAATRRPVHTSGGGANAAAMAAAPVTSGLE